MEEERRTRKRPTSPCNLGISSQLEKESIAKNWLSIYEKSDISSFTPPIIYGWINSANVRNKILKVLVDIILKIDKFANFESRWQKYLSFPATLD